MMHMNIFTYTRRKKYHTISNYDKDKNIRQIQVMLWEAPPTQEAEQKSLNLAVEAERAREETVFLVYGHPLGNTISFKYLLRLLSAMDNYLPESVEKLKKERKNRAHLSQFLGQ